MPCQDTLLQNRIDDDPAFADAVTKNGEAREAAFKAQAELCRVGTLVADGSPVREINFPSIPREPRGIFGDEWGDRVKRMALEDIDRARTAAMHLRQLGRGEVTASCRKWLAEHWRHDLRRLESDNARHKAEILLPRYASGPKHEKRIARIAADTPEIERLKARIAWAEAECGY